MNEKKLVLPAWLPKLIGLTGLSLDFTFHWLQAGDPLQIIFDGQNFNAPDPGYTLFVRILALGAHLMFITAFYQMIITPFQKITIVAGTSRLSPRRLRNKVSLYLERFGPLTHPVKTKGKNDDVQGTLEQSGEASPTPMTS